MRDSEILMICEHALRPYRGGIDAYNRIAKALEQEPVKDIKEYWINIFMFI